MWKLYGLIQLTCGFGQVESMHTMSSAEGVVLQTFRPLRRQEMSFSTHKAVHYPSGPILLIMV